MDVLALSFMTNLSQWEAVDFTYLCKSFQHLDLFYFPSFYSRIVALYFEQHYPSTLLNLSFSSFQEFFISNQTFLEGDFTAAQLAAMLPVLERLFVLNLRFHLTLDYYDSNYVARACQMNNWLFEDKTSSNYIAFLTSIRSACNICQQLPLPRTTSKADKSRMDPADWKAAELDMSECEEVFSSDIPCDDFLPQPADVHPPVGDSGPFVDADDGSELSKDHHYTAAKGFVCSSSKSFLDAMVDSGTQSHIIKDRRVVDSLTPTSMLVQGVGGSPMPVSSLADGTIMLRDANGTPHPWRFSDALFSENFHDNLPSVNAFVKLGAKVIFDSDNPGMWLNGVFFPFIRRDRLFYLPLHFADKTSVHCLHWLMYSLDAPSVTVGHTRARNSSQLELMHRRMGHISLDRLRRIPGKWLDSVNVSGPDFHCETCRIGDSRKKFPSRVPPEAKKSYAVGERVGIDTLGPISHKACNGDVYATFAIDYSSEFKLVFTHKVRSGRLLQF